MFFRSKAGMFFMSLTFIALDLSLPLSAEAGVLTGGTLSAGGAPGTRAAGGGVAEPSGFWDLFDSDCAKRLPATSSPLRRRKTVLGIGEQTPERFRCPMSQPRNFAVPFELRECQPVVSRVRL